MKIFSLHMQPKEAGYIALKDGRKLCLECLDSSIMDTKECQPLNADIQIFYESLNMKLDQQIPLLLVERQALNEAREGEKNVRENAFHLFAVNIIPDNLIVVILIVMRNCFLCFILVIDIESAILGGYINHIICQINYSI